MKREKLKANWADPATTAENERLPRWLKWVWSGRGIAFSLNFLLMAQVTFYCTDMLGMPAAVVGVLLLVSKIFDAFTDVMAGYLIDHTKTKWGKARPYDIFMPLTWICTVLLFSTPNFGMTGKCIYVFLLYTLTNSVCCTLASCGDGIYLKRAIRSENNKVSLTSFQGALLMLFSIAVSIVMPSSSPPSVLRNPAGRSSPSFTPFPWPSSALCVCSPSKRSSPTMTALRQKRPRPPLKMLSVRWARTSSSSSWRSWLLSIR